MFVTHLVKRVGRTNTTFCQGSLAFVPMITVETFTSIINQLLPEPHAGLLNGILFGTKATLSKDLYTALTISGTLHIIALSGTNITILTDLTSLTLLRFISRRTASLLTVVIIIGFIWFIGPTASSVRAGIMGTISLLAILFGRQRWSLLSWMLAVTTMLLLHPPWISDVSFQLSALATLGIILFGGKPTSMAKREPWWQFITDDLRLTLAAQVFTIPIIVWHFHRISLISPLSNVLIGWIIQPLTVLGLVTVAAGVVWLPFGQILAWVAWVPIQYILFVVFATSNIPFASLGW